VTPSTILISAGGEGACQPKPRRRQVKDIAQGVNLAVEAVAAVCRGKVEFLVGPTIPRKKLRLTRQTASTCRAEI